jgi:hypothetical protein
VRVRRLLSNGPDRVGDGVEAAVGRQAQMVDVELGRTGLEKRTPLPGQHTAVGRFGRQRKHVGTNPRLRRGLPKRPDGGNILFHFSPAGDDGGHVGHPRPQFAAAECLRGDERAGGPRIR